MEYLPIKPIDVIIIAYHDNCIDGITSAWIASKKLKEEHPEAEVIYLPMQYNERSIKQLKYRVYEIIETQEIFLYILDYSLPLGDLLMLGYYCSGIIILDHHKTAFERYAPDMEVTPETGWTKICLISSTNSSATFDPYMKGDVTVYLDMTRSGAGMCWDYFYPDDSMPMLVEYVQDYDLWLFEFEEDTKHANLYLNSRFNNVWIKDNLEEKFKILEEFTLNSPNVGQKLEHALEYGKFLRERYDIEIDAIIATPKFIKLGECVGLVVPCEDVEKISDVGNRLAKKSGTFGCTYKIVPEENHVAWSLRSTEESGVDVSEIAKRLFSGGGHINAAGFTLSTEDSMELINNTREITDLEWRENLAAFKHLRSLERI